MEKVKANLFIVGAMKAGTTSFNEMLSEQPNIYFSPIKEPNYFVKKLPKSLYEPSRYFNINEYFKNKYPKNLHIAHLKELGHYEKLFSLASESHIYKAEGSTAYLHATESAKLIYKYNPNVKIIILLRDPLKRAFSHYKMDLGLGRITTSFHIEIEKNIEDYKNNKLSNWSYLGMSLYNRNIKRYKNLFGDNVLILQFEDVINNNLKTLSELNEFLDIKLHSLALQHSNKTGNLRFQKILFLFKKIGLKDIFSFFVSKKIKHYFFNLLNKKKPLELTLSKSTLEELKKIFQSDKDKYKKLLQ